jgi:hypothetical protein
VLLLEQVAIVCARLVEADVEDVVLVAVEVVVLEVECFELRNVRLWQPW